MLKLTFPDINNFCQSNTFYILNCKLNIEIIQG